MEKNMHKELMELLDRAYCPYSKVQVSAILVLNDGRWIKGVNVENASSGGTVCAERNALLHSVTEGVKPQDIKELNVASSMDFFLYPCAICRQTMTELMPFATPVVVWHKDGRTEKTTVGELVPHAVEKGFY